MPGRTYGIHKNLYIAEKMSVPVKEWKYIPLVFTGNRLVVAPMLYASNTQGCINAINAAIINAALGPRPL